jgi:hypothetical protein
LGLFLFSGDFRPTSGGCFTYQRFFDMVCIKLGKGKSTLPSKHHIFGWLFVSYTVLSPNKKSFLINRNDLVLLHLSPDKWFLLNVVYLLHYFYYQNVKSSQAFLFFNGLSSAYVLTVVCILECPARVDTVFIFTFCDMRFEINVRLPE